MAKVRIGAIEESLVEKTKQYKELTGTSTVKLIEELLTDFFNNTFLTNDFIEPEEPFYFNVKDLLANYKVKATNEKPIVNDYVKVKKVPNNLDDFDKELKKYCYGSSEQHLGVFTWCKVNLNLLKLNKSNIMYFDLLFKYNSKKEELFISIININDLSDNFHKLQDLFKYNEKYVEFEERLKKLPDDYDYTFLFSNSKTEGMLDLYLGSLNILESSKESLEFIEQYIKLHSERAV